MRKGVRLLFALGALAVLIGASVTAVIETLSERPPPDYEREDGPRIPRAELRGQLDYDSSIAGNICDASSPSLRRDARRERRLLERLAGTRPDHRFKTKTAYSDYGDIGRDVTAREYAENSAELLREVFGSKRMSGCVARNAARLERIARGSPDP